MLNHQLIERYFFLLLSLELMSIGIVFISHGDLGIPPFLSLSYVLSSYFKSSLFLNDLLQQIFFIIIQILILKQNFKKIQLCQIFIWLLLNIFLSINNIIFLGNFYPKNYLVKILFLLFGSFLIGIGINIQLFIKTIYTPCEGLFLTIYNILQYNICYTKIIYDFILILLTTIFSYLLFGSIIGVKEGTIVCGIFIGFFFGTFNERVGKIVIDFLYRSCPENKGEENFNDNLFIDDQMYNKKDDFINSLNIWE